MVHVPCRYHTTLEEEKERYDLHRNDPENQGYMNLLGKLFAPVRDRLKPGSRGLDFGSGPSPVLASLFREEGYGMAIFDKFYANNPGVFDARYDFVTASEVAEHLCDPFRELNRLYGILKPGGLLGILTGMLPCAEKFPKWHYKNDKTHICFFAASTFRWIAGEWGSEIVYLEDDVVIIRKPALAEMH